MESHCIPYRDTAAFSAAVISYLAGDDKLLPFYSHPPSIAGFNSLLEAKKITGDRDLLAAVLEEQYSSLAIHPDVAANISALKEPGTFTVTTGHQLNIFTGPLYFIYKIVTAINLARQLTVTFPGKKFVPVYWMATEDHDFAEINHLTINGTLLSWSQHQQGATGKIPAASIKDTLGNYISQLGNSEFASSLALAVETAYSGRPDLSSATRTLVNSIFERYGLVIIDADDTRLKQQFAPIITRDILEQNSYREISASSAGLEDAGYQPQVNPREINFFYLTAGSRERIIFEDGRYRVLNSAVNFTADELAGEIKDHPERFSPNVLMRPLYQELILPNVAYIGGGAEIVYWLQLKRLFDFYGADYPVLILRNSALIINNELDTELKKLGLTYEDLFSNANALAKKFTLSNSANDLSAKCEQQAITSVFEKLKTRLSAIDPTLVPSAAAIEARLQHAFGNLEKKILKAEKRNFGETLSKLTRLRENVFPTGSLQERVENFGLFYAKYGDAFIDELVKHFEPLEFKFTVLVED